MKKETIRNLLAASILVCTTSVSQANVVESWNYTLNMNWDTSATHFHGDGKKDNRSPYIGWGYSKNDNSYIWIDAPKATGNINVGGAPAPKDYVQFTHYNGRKDTYDTGLTSAVLDVSIQLMLPGTTTVIADLSESFEVHFFGLANCTSLLGVDASGIDFTKTFDYDGMRYEVNFFEASTSPRFKPLSDSECQLLGLGSGCLGFTTGLGSSTSAWFRVSVTAVPIPEPETYAMMLAGLGMVGIIARRRRSATRN